MAGIQVVISILSRGRLDDYVECLEESLQDMSMVQVKLTNSSLPVSKHPEYVCIACNSYMYNTG